MTYTITEFEDTPNPNAVKCKLDRPISDGVRSFLDPDSARDDEIASALFASGTVANLLFNGDWLTVSKTSDADWPSVKRHVKKVLAAGA